MLPYSAAICLELSSRQFFSAFGCSNTEISDTARLLFLNAHNEARLNVAKGLEPNKCGLLSPAKNMYKLQWDCNLEQQAQDYIANCPNSMGSFSGLSQNIMTYTGASLEPLSTAATVLTKWWNPIRQYGSTAPENKYVNSNLYSFANMVHGKMTGIGCAYKKCTDTNKLTVTCLYNKIGYYTNGIMWENGTACTSDAECTTYPGSTCSNNLCVKELEQTEITFLLLFEALQNLDTGANTMCPSNANMTDAARKKFLEVHNYLRSRVARGLEPDALGGNAPKASKMLKMVYDCNVEASAIQHSQKCVYAHSDSADRPGLGENLFKTTALNVDRTSIAAESSQMWWDELKEAGVGPSNNLTDALWNRTGKVIGHYSQMAWDRTYKLGCSVQHCSSFTYSVCQYGPAGNYLNQLIYALGEPCTDDSGCPGTYTCNASEGLCNVV
ncbi:SCP-like protein [Oesophagostomum dentatum]|uniref:SCP-like protein n=1 Tax=Oesophagostomum dentatum TaxID=61180 RepID=A0A0B1T3W9_OESDE|nr:SCP-like protein [Oesophagostomum dentatum]